MKKTVIIASSIIVSLMIVTALIMIFLVIPTMKYNKAVSYMENGNYETAIAYFEKVSNFKDSKIKIAECNDKLKNEKYLEALRLKDNKNYEEAIRIFQELSGYKDSNKQIASCENEKKNDDYNKALEEKNKGNYKTAKEMFGKLNGYKDSNEQIAGVIKESIKEAYKSVMKQYYANEIFNDYSLYDIDKDGIKELIISKGTCEADRYYYFYTFDTATEKAVSIGKTDSCHCCLYTNPNANGILMEYGHMGYYALERITVNNRKITITELKNEDYNSYDEDGDAYGFEGYPDPSEIVKGALYIDEFPLNNYYLLEQL